MSDNRIRYRLVIWQEHPADDRSPNGFSTIIDIFETDHSETQARWLAELRIKALKAAGVNIRVTVEQTGVRSLEFHQDEWSHRPLRRYAVQLEDGRVFVMWAHDAVDAREAVDDGTVVLYGSFDPDWSICLKPVTSVQGCSELAAAVQAQS